MAFDIPISKFMKNTKQILHQNVLNIGYLKNCTFILYNNYYNTL